MKISKLPILKNWIIVQAKPISDVQATKVVG